MSKSPGDVKEKFWSKNVTGIKPGRQLTKSEYITNCLDRNMRTNYL